MMCFKKETKKTQSMYFFNLVKNLFVNYFFLKCSSLETKSVVF